MAFSYFPLLIMFTNFLSIAFAFDPRPLQDFCVADPNSPVRLGGALPCKDPSTVTADDFFLCGLLDGPGNTTNPFGIGLTEVGVSVIPGLNTMGLSMARLDLAPGGAFPLHTHHRASELHIVLEGALEVGFITSAPDYKLYNKTLKKGCVLVVPMGLIHYQRNAWTGNTTSLAVLNSQNPGINSVTRAVFGANPTINTHYLAGAYQLDDNTIKNLQGKTWV